MGGGSEGQTRNGYIEKVLAKHDSKIEQLDKDIKNIQRNLSTVNDTLNEVKTLLVANPAFNMKDIIAYIRDVALVVGVGVTAIVYVVGATYSSDLTLMKERDRIQMERLDRIERDFMRKSHGL